ncbi:MAG: head GIN domain-containing protein [Segetibacter sp.]
MKNLLKLYTAICIVISFSCNIGIGSRRINGNGKIASHARNVSSANKIKVTGDMDVIVSTGNTRVKVEADENIIPYIKTEMNGNWLVIKTENNLSINSKNPVRVYITTPRITDVEVTGSGNVTTESKFDADNKIDFSITGSGNINFNVNAPRVDANITGSGSLHVAGETRDVNINLAGSGNYEGRELKAENAKVTIAGSGDADVFAEENLQVKIMGSGSVKYSGNARVDRKIMGSGSVVKAD